MFSFHLATVNPLRGAATLIRPPRPATVPGLRRAEVLACMRLGAPVFSPSRLELGRIAMFAEWDDDAALDRFLATPGIGERFGAGWHLRLEFLRRWGTVAGFDQLPEEAQRTDPSEPVVAVTLARMRLPELVRFIHWGRPVERQVRDHPGTSMALAAIRPPRTVSTFSMWNSAREMTGMVFGRDAGAGSQRHVDAMAERERRDFHHAFTTLRFRTLSEHGSRPSFGSLSGRSRLDRG